MHEVGLMENALAIALEYAAREGAERIEKLPLLEGAIVGDLATENDARGLRAAGAEAVQITTGTACHLEAEAIGRAMDRLPLETLDVLAIENVGEFSLSGGLRFWETPRVVLLSVTEGEDKPLKYPTVFRAADVVVLTKVDIAEAVVFEREEVLGTIRRMAAQAEVIEVSVRSGVGWRSGFPIYKAISRAARIQALLNDYRQGTGIGNKLIFFR